MAKKPPPVALRKPSAPADPLAADAFVGGQPSERSSGRASKRPAAKRRGIVERADGRELRRMTVYLEPGLARKLEVHCLERERDMSDVIAEALARVLGRPAG